MTSRTHQNDEKPIASSEVRVPIRLKDVKLKDRIHLFEGLSNQSNASNNKNTSSNNSEQVFHGRLPKVVSPEHKRWTQVGTGMPEANTPPWLRRDNEDSLKRPVGQNTLSPLVAERTKYRSKTLGSRSRDGVATEKPRLPSKPSPTPTPSPRKTQKERFVFPADSGIPAKMDKPKVESATAPMRPDIVYVDGTPVKMRNGRKWSTDCTAERSSVSLMINSFENQGEARAVESKKRNGAGLDVIPANNIQRRSAELTQRGHQESRTRTRQELELRNSPPRNLVRRRSKSASDIHQHVIDFPKVSPAPFKPKRTYEHDIYMETKKVIMQRENPKKENGLVNPLYGVHAEDEDDNLKPQPQRLYPATETGRPMSEPCAPFTKSLGKHKKLPAVPNVPPYVPPPDKLRDRSSQITTDVSKSSEVHHASAISPHFKVTSPREHPRSETVPISTLDRKRGSLQRSFSSEDISKLASGYMPLKSLSPTRKQGASEYAEPIVPADIKRANSDVSIFSKSEQREAVVDSEGYSVPGSHLWKKLEPHEELNKSSGPHGRGHSWKTMHLSGPNTPSRRVRIFEPGKVRASFPGKDYNEELLPEELSRNRKASSERKPGTRHTYTEPGCHADDDVTPGPSIRQRSRLVTMRRKINDAFRRPRHVQTLTDDDRSSVTSEDSDGEVNEAVMHKRLNHARAVKKRSSVYCNADKYRRILKESKLYDYLVVVSLEFNNETRRYQPIEKSRYPEELSASQNDKLRAIPHFCFPDAFKWAPVEKYQSESYSFVLTSIDGSRLYGYNRRLLPPGDKPRLPEVFCIITPISCRLLFTQLLDEIEKRRMVSKKEMEKLIRDAYTRQVPPPGGYTTIMQMDSDGKRTSLMKPLLLQRPQDSRLEHVDFDCLFSSLKIHQVVQIFASLLLERRVIMCSGKLSKLSKCSQAVAALLYPFAWQHIYIPVLPEKLIDMSCSPTPYIMGMLSLCIPKLDELPIDEVLIVDLDSKDFYTVVGDEETIIPKKLVIALERALNEICSYNFVDGNGLEDELSSDDHEAKNRTISEIFIRYFVETCGHYMNHFSTKYDGNLKFDREGFIKVVTSRSIRRFLEVFTESQMFSMFIQEKEAEVEGIAQGLFETRVREWEAQCKVNANKFGAKVKKIGRVVKDISREGGKKVADTAKDVRTRVKANLDSKI